jgi:hypothetical protein
MFPRQEVMLFKISGFTIILIGLASTSKLVRKISDGP